MSYIPEFTGSFTNLRYLDLSHSSFGGRIPPTLGYLLQLRYLDLGDNILWGEIPFQIGNLKHLEYLDIGGFYLSGKIPYQIGNLIKLQYLSLGSNTLLYRRNMENYASNCLSGAIPFRMGNLPLLHTLRLSGNFDIQVTDAKWLSTLHSLTILELSSLHNLSSSHQWLQSIRELIPNLSELRLINCDLLDNDVQSLFHSHSSNNFISLNILELSSNTLTSSTLQFLFNFSFHLQELDLSHSNIALPPYPCSNFPSLKGSIPNLQLKLPYRPSINLNSNRFEGKIPLFLLQASELLLSGNKFSDLFSFLCGNVTAASMATLDLSDNQIKEQFSDCWKSVNRLLFLDLSNNQLSGKIPNSMGTLVKLEALVLRNNSLMGELPSSLKKSKNLIMLDVSENILSGPIPSWVGESMQQLIILIMRGNHFSGNLPLHICYLKHIQLLDLSQNKFSEGIPTCLNNFTALSEKSINKTETQSRVHWYNTTYSEIYSFYSGTYYALHVTWTWKGVERIFKHPELLLQSIDLSCNKLTGEMPKEITYMVGLVSLNLSRNHLSGEIPSGIGNLSSLDFLDLSRNHLSGKIPSTLSNIDRLAMLDLSNNHLSGRIPWGRQLQTFDVSSFEGNVDLCGKPLEESCPGDETVTKSKGAEVDDEEDKSVLYGALYMSLGIGFFTGFWGLLGLLLLWQPWRMAYLRFLNILIDYLLLMVALNRVKCQSWLKD
ncbi:hypothetical protein LR48_Vigan10g128000 [Vigna angularis]|uniref:Disease resistance R13L4/SHOC-2-like LRR domain-containing protein n=1 Tax=Phaseolus angularis TaxID=3914 RepID=A0A0L9VK72_PHAAN|nr:hypothetical protein LR48_Vigan10g128000 [Vigna angularis]